MKVLQISQRKGSDKIASTTADASLADAAAKLSELRIGCLLVLNADGSMAGILSERDIVRTLGVTGGACLTQPVSSVMTSNVVTCSPDDSADSVLGKMTSGRFRHMPVTKDGKLVGLISIGDVVKARIEALEHDNEALESMIRSATA